MTSSELQSLAIAGAILYGAYKFGPGIVQAGAVAVAAVIVAKKIPYVQTQL